MRYLKSAMAHLTWRGLLIPEALALSVASLQLLVYWTPDTARLLPAAYVAGWLGFTLALVVAALIADDSCRRGARLLPAYSVALIGAITISGVALGVAWQLSPLWFDRHWPFSWFRVLAMGIDWAEFGGFGLAAYVNRRLAIQILSGLRAGQLRRVQLERQLVASTLAATEAQMDPQLLINSLSVVCAGLERGDPHALQRLDDLIRSLRATLTRTIAADDSAAARP